MMSSMMVVFVVCGRERAINVSHNPRDCEIDLLSGVQLKCVVCVFWDNFHESHGIEHPRGEFFLRTHTFFFSHSHTHFRNQKEMAYGEEKSVCVCVHTFSERRGNHRALHSALFFRSRCWFIRKYEKKVMCLCMCAARNVCGEKNKENVEKANNNGTSRE
jgi:hypothetical protein